MNVNGWLMGEWVSKIDLEPRPYMQSHSQTHVYVQACTRT